MRIELRRGRGLTNGNWSDGPWDTIDGSNQIGVMDATVFDGSHLLTRLELAERFRADTPLTSVVQGFNGSFRVARVGGGGVELAVDLVRSLPLYYSVSPEAVVVSDHAADCGSDGPDPLGQAQVRVCGWTWGRRTMFAGVSQVRAGTTVTIRADGSVQEHVHASHRREASAIQAPEIPEPRAFKELNVLSGTFTDRLVEVAGGRPIVVTLSGGYDSRYIAAQLKLRGHENVMLITYGRSDSIDVATARRVADRLGYRWEFVEYTNSTMRKVGASDWFVDYMRRAGGGSATAHAQDAAALRQLLERGILDPTSLIVPGFCGDLLGGSCIPPGSTTVAGNSQYEREGLAAYALRTQAYFRNPVDPHELVELQRSIATEVQSVGPFWHDQETWFATTKVPNYVCNAVRLYDYLGLAWWLPLWDRSLVEWWHKVPPAQLARKHLYDHYLASEVFEPLGIAFNTPHNWLHRASVAQLRRRVPPSLQRAARRTYYGARRVRGVSYDNLNNFATLTESLMAATGVSYHRPVRDDIDVLSALANWTVGIG